MGAEYLRISCLYFCRICLLLSTGEKDWNVHICRSSYNPRRTVWKLYRALRDRELYLNGYSSPPLVPAAGFGRDLCAELPAVYTDL